MRFCALFLLCNKSRKKEQKNLKQKFKNRRKSDVNMLESITFPLY